MLLKTKRRVIKRVGKSVSEGEWLKGWKTKGKKKTLHSLWVLLSQIENLSIAIFFFIN